MGLEGFYNLPEHERRNDLGTERLGEIDIPVKILTTSTRPERPIEAELFHGLGFFFLLRWRAKKAGPSEIALWK